MRRRRSLSPHRGAAAETTLHPSIADSASVFHGAAAAENATVFDAMMMNGFDVSRLVACNESLIASAPPSRNVSFDMPQSELAHRRSTVAPPKTTGIEKAENFSTQKASQQLQSSSILAGRHAAGSQWETLSSMTISDFTAAAGRSPDRRPAPRVIDAGAAARQQLPAAGLLVSEPAEMNFKKPSSTPYELALDLCCNDLLDSVRRIHEQQEAHRLKCVQQRRKLAQMYRVPYAPPHAEPRPKQRRSVGNSTDNFRRAVSASVKERTKTTHPARSHSAAAPALHVPMQSSASEVLLAKQSKSTTNTSLRERAAVSGTDRKVAQGNLGPAQRATPSVTPPSDALGISPAPIAVSSAALEVMSPQIDAADHHSCTPASLVSSLPQRTPPLPLKSASASGGRESTTTTRRSAGSELLMFLRPRPAPRPWRNFDADRSVAPEQAPRPIPPPSRVSDGNETVKGDTPTVTYKCFVPTFVLNDFHRRAVLRECWVTLKCSFQNRQCDAFRRRWTLRSALSSWREKSANSAEHSTEARRYMLRSVWRRVLSAVNVQRALREMSSNQTLKMKRRVFYSWLQDFHTQRLVGLAVRKRSTATCACLLRRWQLLARWRVSHRRAALAACWRRWTRALDIERRLLITLGAHGARNKFAVEALSRHTVLVLMSRYWSLWRKSHRSAHFRKQLEDVADKSCAMKLLHFVWRRWSIRRLARERAKQQQILDR